MYRYERLSDDIKIAVSDCHTFGTDAVILANFANIKHRDTAMDMGSGCGIIPFLWLRDSEIKSVHCLDIQENACEQIRHSAELNKIEEKINIRNCDLREISKHYDAEKFTLVTMNPPYKPVGTGIESAADSAKIARHETCCNIDDVCKAASYLLKYSGRFCMCHRPERLADVIEIMRKYKLEPKRLQFVQDTVQGKPFLFLIQSQKGAKPFLKVEPTLIIKKENGKFTPQMLDIYGSYADGYDR